MIYVTNHEAPNNNTNNIKTITTKKIITINNNLQFLHNTYAQYYKKYKIKSSNSQNINQKHSTESTFH